MKKCSSGKERNRSTGRCRRKSIKPTKKPCESGKSRNRSTGRCRRKSIKLSRKPCESGKIRNRSTGRCRKSIKLSRKPCVIGKTRNRSTGRCRRSKKKSIERNAAETLRCKRCHSKILYPEYDGAPLTCRGCGTIGDVETLPDDDELSYLFSKFHVKPMFDLHLEMVKFSKIFEEKEKIKSQDDDDFSLFMKKLNLQN